jgi:hypothetical protein
MKHLLLILFTMASALGQQAALKEQALPAINAKILIPEGWFTKEESDDGVTVYQVSREKAETEEDVFSAGLILSVTQDEGDGAKLQRTEEGPFQCLRLEYTIESTEGNIKVINLAKANDSTGTLYFATWQSPEKEEPQLKELREAVLASMKFDPTF